MAERIHIDTRAGYDRWAEIYDDELNPLVLLEQDVVRAWMESAARKLGRLGSTKSGIERPLGGMRVADVGCGTGRHALWLAEQGAAVDAFDFSEGMLAKARVKLERSGVRIHQHALPDPLPAADRSFDVTMMALVADHLGDLEGVFRDLHRVTRHDGMGLVTVLHPAMNLKGLTARFTDPETGDEVRVKAFEHAYADYVMGVLRAGWGIDEIVERKSDQALVSRTPRAEKYLGWPLLLALRLKS
jgi:malonyl-CoA O-methyltransferase